MTRKPLFSYRQGDVLLIRRRRVIYLYGEKGKKEDKILLYGETTGHAHRFRKDSKVDVLEVEKPLWVGPELLFMYKLDVKEPSELIHEDHDTIVVEPGMYEVRRQREATDEDDFALVMD
jgi:hypothetical protein